MTLRLERMGVGKKAALALFGLIVIATPILLGQSEAAQRVMLAAVDAAPLPFRTAVHAMLAEEQTQSTALIAELQPATEMQSDAKPIAFDVVSIRPVDPDPNLRKRRSGFQFTDDGFVSTNQSLLMTLLRQYRTELQLGPNGIVGGPDWVRTIQWDIRAKVADSDISEWSKLSNDSSAAAKERRNATLQAMLADRFKLKTHLETREGTIYALVVAKGGPKLKPSTPGGSTGFEMGQGHMNFKHATIGGVVALFAQELGNPVVDKSGLTGDYDFTLDWASDQKAATPGGQASATSEPSGPSIFTAVQEQLGLKLEARKGSIETLVIDSAEKPSVDGAEVEDASIKPVALVQEKSATKSDTRSSTGAANKAAFEVASVRPVKSDCSFTTYGGPPGRYTALCTTLWGLIYNAYDVRSFNDYPTGLPTWADKDRFDVDAKANDDTVAAIRKLSNQEQEQLTRDMLQSLLADRFQLRVHYESKVQPIYELVLAKGGSKLKPLPADQKPGWGKFDRGEFILRGKSIAEFANGLSFSNLVGRTVVDKTGLIGNYDIDLKWTPDDQQGTPDAGPTFFTALEEQLGLKLEAAKGPVDTLVIDHVEKPSEN